MKQFAIAIFGPTGVGKTSLSLEIAREYGEIISVDSRQIYKYMDIGTAKPTKSEQALVKHHLIDIITPSEVYTAGNFSRSANDIIKEILQRGKIPFLVGGTGFYFNALIDGLSDIPHINSMVKDRVRTKWERKGQQRLYEILSVVDNKYSNMIHPNDKQRTLRALEVYFSTGKRISCFFDEHKKRQSDIDFVKIGINIDRQQLYKRIDQRVDNMIKEGFIEEVKNIINMGFGEESPGLNSIGYKEIILYLKDLISFDEALYEIKKNTRHYAKRQLTWFNKTDDVKWFDNDSVEKIKEYICERTGAEIW